MFGLDEEILRKRDVIDIDIVNDPISPMVCERIHQIISFRPISVNIIPIHSYAHRNGIQSLSFVEPTHIIE